MLRNGPALFTRLSRQPGPSHIRIGCSDSRVPANQIIGLMPGEMFVHRNFAYVFVHNDLNALSPLRFAVAVLRVSHVVVSGHYGCGGILSALRGDRYGLVDNWLRHASDVRDKHLTRPGPRGTAAEEHDRLCRPNFVEQVLNVTETTVVRDAWARGPSLSVHGWTCGIEDSLLEDLEITGTNEAEVSASCAQAVATLVGLGRTPRASVSSPSRPRG